MRPPALLSLASLLLAPTHPALGEEGARRPCVVTLIHAVKSAGPRVPALEPYQAHLNAKAYKKWKSFVMLNQARYSLPPGGRARLAAAQAPLEFSVVSREKGVTRTTFKVGKRQAVPLTLTETSPAQLVEGGPWEGGLLLYGVRCDPAP